VYKEIRNPKSSLFLIKTVNVSVSHLSDILAHYLLYSPGVGCLTMANNRPEDLF